MVGNVALYPRELLMAADSDSRRRRIRIPEIEREYWRRVVFDEISSRDDVRSLIEQDLEPLWQATGSELREMTDDEERNRVVTEIWQRKRLLPSQIAFQDAVNRITIKKLRCVYQGKSAEWVEAYVKAAAKERLPDGPFQPDLSEPLPDDPDRDPLDTLQFHEGEPLPTLEVNLMFQAGPYGTTIQASGTDFQQRMFGPDLYEEAVDETGTWDNWEQFRDRVLTVANHFVRAMEWEFKRRNPTTVNVGADASRRQAAKDLVAYLVDRQRLTHDRARRERLRKFARLVGLDFPLPTDRSPRTKRRPQTMIIPVRRQQ
jgi:hypothetical protein